MNHIITTKEEAVSSLLRRLGITSTGDFEADLTNLQKELSSLKNSDPKKFMELAKETLDGLEVLRDVINTIESEVQKFRK